jgi:hypothetical protein
MIHYYIALSGRKYARPFFSKALSFQDVAIGLGYYGLAAQSFYSFIF